MAIVSNFSKLIIDPSLPICNSNLIKAFWDKDQNNEDPQLISINKNYRLWERLSEMYLEY